MNLVWNQTGTGRLTLYYDSVEELGRLACFKCLLFRFEEDHFRIEYVAFTLSRGNTTSSYFSEGNSQCFVSGKMFSLRRARV